MRKKGIEKRKNARFGKKYDRRDCEWYPRKGEMVFSFFKMLTVNLANYETLFSLYEKVEIFFL